MSKLKTLYTEAGFDYDSAIDRTLNDEDMLIQLVKAFVQDTGISTLENAVREGDVMTAFRAAHSLKGSSGMLGFTGFFDAICPVTESLRAGNLTDISAVISSFEIIRKIAEQV